MNVTSNTCSHDGSYEPPPTVLGSFTAVTAQDGIRRVAGWSQASEYFGQTLTAPLVAGESYTLSGYLSQAKRSALDQTGGYNVFLTSGAARPWRMITPDRASGKLLWSMPDGARLKTSIRSNAVLVVTDRVQLWS